MEFRILAHDDPALEPHREALRRHAAESEMLGIPYWVFLEGPGPVGLVLLGREPVLLLAPIGTPLSIVKAVNPERPEETLREFASWVITLSKEKGVDYSYLSFPAQHEELHAQFIGADFRELADTYRMVCKLEGPYEPLGDLRFELVEKSDLTRFIELAIDFMSGSPDIVLTMALENLRGMGEEMLDLWYGLEKFFIVRRGEEAIGILDLNVKEGVISNVGVAPRHRGRGYERPIILHGMMTLKEDGREVASLRVHVDNEAAINLYESLGFSVGDRIKHLIWRR
jgi:ribosomal protein S18 acetylase RimI-like enzyme